MNKETIKKLVQFNERALDLIIDMLTEKQGDELLAAVTASEKTRRISELEASIAKQSAELATLKGDKQ